MLQLGIFLSLAWVGVHGFTFTDLSGASRAVQKQWQVTMKSLEEEFNEEYFTVKAQWKQELECASCLTVMADFSVIIEELASWTSSVPTETAYLERFTPICEEIEDVYGIAAIENYNPKRPWHEQSPATTSSMIRIVEKDQEPTLTMPFLRRSLANTCNSILDNHLALLMTRNLSIPTARYAVFSICVKQLKVCDEKALTTRLYSSPSKSEIERFRAKGKFALQQFWNELSDKNSSERRRIRCMACDVTLAHIQDEIGWRNPNVQKRHIHPTVAQLVKTCGTKDTWESWGLWYNFWSEQVVAPYFLKEKNLSHSAIKLQVDVVPLLLFDVCKEVAQTSKTDLDGYEEPIPNCHNMPWCQFTEWESDSRSADTVRVLEFERDKAKTKWLRVGKEALEPEETDEEIEEEERLEAKLAAQKKAERAQKRGKPKRGEL